jgi:hypothetical protein
MRSEGGGEGGRDIQCTTRSQHGSRTQFGCMHRLRCQSWVLRPEAWRLSCRHWRSKCESKVGQELECRRDLDRHREKPSHLAPPEEQHQHCYSRAEPEPPIPLNQFSSISIIERKKEITYLTLNNTASSARCSVAFSRANNNVVIIRVKELAARECMPIGDLFVAIINDVLSHLCQNMRINTNNEVVLRHTTG